MSRIIFILCCLASLAFAGRAHAADPWTTTDIALESVYVALDTADFAQTRYIAQHPAAYYESASSAMIGQHPSTGRVGTYFAAGLVAQVVITDLLPHPWRNAWQAAGIAIEAHCVSHNASIGIKFSF